MQRFYIQIILVVLISVNISLQSEAQKAKTDIPVRLAWEEPKELIQGEMLLYFDGAVNFDSLGLLPAFQTFLPENYFVDKEDVSLEDVVYKPLQLNQASFYPDLELVSEQPKIYVSTVTIRKVTRQSLYVLPIRKAESGNGYERLDSFKIIIKSTEGQATRPSAPKLTRNYAQHSVLSSGDWYKISVDQSGIYKITYSDLEGMGINAEAINPRNIRIYGNGGGMLEEANALARPDDLTENSIFVKGEEDGVFNPDDYILFYGEGPVVIKFNPFYDQFEHELNFYTNETYYFLTVGNSPGKRVAEGEPINETATHELRTFQDLAWYEKENVNLIKSGKIWYGEVFNQQVEYTFPFDLAGIDLSQPVIFKGNLAARSTIKTEFNVYANNQHVVALDVPSVLLGSQIYARPIISNYETFYADKEQLDLKITFDKPSNIDIAWLNYIELNYIRHLDFTGGQLIFQDMRYVSDGNIGLFHVGSTNQALNIWEVTNRSSIKSPVLTNEQGGVSFKAPLDTFREFIAFDGSEYFTPAFVEKVENQDLHSLGSADFIIVSHPLFLSQANRLADFHLQHDGLTYQIVTPQQIYNEFSSGAQDVSAIRDFMKMLYDRADSGKEPRYMLLFGDASYDYKNILPVDNNFVPAYESREALKVSASYVTDDYFGCLDDDEGSNGTGTMDVGIGRFPVTTPEQADAMVTKNINYMLPNRENFGPWRNRITYIGDDKDNNTHLNQAEGLAEITDSLGTVYNVDKIYLDAYVQFKTGNGIRYPDVNKAINKDVSDGCLIMNYTGHGGEIAWADERVLDIPAIQSFKNNKNLPVFVTATCEFSRYDDPSLVSAGELVFLNPDGAGIGLFTTTRLAFSTSNYAYNKRFYYDAFTIDSATGEFPRLGDLIIAAKTPSNTNIKNFVLLGDPALMLSYPKMNVKTLSIKNEALGRPADTIHALSRVTIEGQVEDLLGNRLEGFNGLLYTSIYDKPVEYKTRGNDPASKVTDFYIQDKKIYIGEASITAGFFSFSFIVPVDISYQYGEGKISYYALDTVNLIDANGFDPVMIGGSDNLASPDNTGPVIDLYLNTMSFKSGDQTTNDPLLIANLFDESGINATGNGIGHDLVAIIDGDYQQQIVLNDYYTPALDSSQAGTIKYRLGPFANGVHTLTLKAWDVANNSSEATIEFEVNEGARLNVYNLQTRPNPYRESTSFFFEHNKPGSDLDVYIHIFDLMGKHVTSLHYNIQSESTESGLLYWNGKDGSGNELPAGLYVYNLIVKSGDGFHISVSQKLLHY